MVPPSRPSAGSPSPGRPAFYEQPRNPPRPTRVWEAFELVCLPRILVARTRSGLGDAVFLPLMPRARIASRSEKYWNPSYEVLKMKSVETTIGKGKRSLTCYWLFILISLSFQIPQCGRYVQWRAPAGIFTGRSGMVPRVAGIIR
ncbi:hypothetical protein ACJJTC_016713 [Scirpophaga incertulas]